MRFKLRKSKEKGGKFGVWRLRFGVYSRGSVKLPRKKVVVKEKESSFGQNNPKR